MAKFSSNTKAKLQQLIVAFSNFSAVVWKENRECISEGKLGG